MSNQRVVVLTDEEIHACISALAKEIDNSIAAGTAEAELTAVLKHSEGITDEMVGRALAKGGEFAPEDDGFQAMRACLEAAFFPGDGEA